MLQGDVSQGAELQCGELQGHVKPGAVFHSAECRV